MDDEKKTSTNNSKEQIGDDKHHTEEKRMPEKEKVSPSEDAMKQKEDAITSEAPPVSTQNQSDKREETDPSLLLIFNSLGQIGEIMNYLEEPGVLEFAKPIKDSKGNVLVQSDIPINDKILTNLQLRKSEELPAIFVFKYTRRLQDAYKKRIGKSLFICLEPNRYHVAHELFSLSQLDLLALSKSSLNNRTIIDIFVKYDMEYSPVLPHLGETALLSAAIADLLCLSAKIVHDHKKIVNLAFLAGLLHDISLIDDADFLLNDIENAKESGHEKKSQEFIRKHLNDVDPLVLKVIGDHHRLKARYIQDSIPELTPELLISEALSFSEFFFGQVRSIYKYRLKASENVTEKVFFYIGQVFGEGFFHPELYSVMSKIQKRLKEIIKYGEDIALLEKKCIHGNSAVAYPKPRCTQVLCQKKLMDCKLIQPGFPIRVITESKFFGLSWKSVKKGDYPKCKLTKKLPPQPDAIKTI